MKMRRAEKGDLDEIFQISFENWPRGETLERHRKGCYSHENYQKGVWYVLGTSGALKSVLILYSFDPKLRGIGTVMTPLDQRGKGYASELLRQVIEMCDLEDPVPNLLLFSEIKPSFYERFGFQALPKSFQKKEGTACMIRFPGGQKGPFAFPKTIPDPF